MHVNLDFVSHNFDFFLCNSEKKKAELQDVNSRILTCFIVILRLCITVVYLYLAILSLHHTILHLYLTILSLYLGNAIKKSKLCDKKSIKSKSKKKNTFSILFIYYYLSCGRIKLHIYIKKKKSLFHSLKCIVARRLQIHC